MTWTLWRGDDLLGMLHERSVPKSLHQTRQDARHVNAVLVPDPARLPLPSVRQHVMKWAGRHTVMERILKPEIAGDRRRDAGPDGTAVGAWVVPASPAPPPTGVPAPRQLRVRDEDGRIVSTRYIAVHEHRPDPAHLPPELATFPEGAFVGWSVWLVAFTQDPDAPAT